MPILSVRTPLPVSAHEAYSWHTRPGAFERLTPPWETARMLDAKFPFTDGTRWTFRSRVFGPLKRDWLVEHFNVKPGEQFSYRLLKGSFRRWEHTLRFLPAESGSVHLNEIEYELPLGPVCEWFVRARINKMFAYRQRVLADDLARWTRFRDSPRLTIALTGSRGLIGSQLVHWLTVNGHRVIRLVSGTFSRPVYDDGTEWRGWKPREPLPAGSLKGVDAVIHLAGDNIAAGRWTEAKKQRLRESRIVPTRHLAEAIDRDGVRTFLCGSAVGYYGNRGDEIVTEASPMGRGFLAELSKDWEEASECSARVVNLRTGHVLWPSGGLLGKLLPSFRAGGGAVLGDGTQVLSWISLQDYLYAIDHFLMSGEASGPFNLTAPQPATNREFGRTLAKVLGRPFLLTAPKFALRWVFGDMAEEALLTGQRAMPAKLAENQFAYSHPDLETTLRFLLAKGP